jgi:uncharacterized protein YdaU (DUF1376 family)
MSDEEFGFYVRCLNHAWLNNGLPVEIAEIARVMRKTPKQFLKLWARVGRSFTIFEENYEKRFKNSRQERQRQQQENYKKNRVEAANSRWLNKATMHMHDLADANGMHVQCSSSSSSSSTSIKETTAKAVAKKDSANAPSDAKGSRLLEETLPAEWCDWACSKLGWDLERCQRVFEEFHDYWVAVPGAKGRKLKWFPTWKNRCRELSQRNVPRQQALAQYESNTDRAIKRAYELHEQGLL